MSAIIEMYILYTCCILLHFFLSKELFKLGKKYNKLKAFFLDMGFF